VVVVLSVALASGASLYIVKHSHTSVVERFTATPSFSGSPGLSIPAVLAKVEPAVVSIYTSGVSVSGLSLGTFQGAGTGTIITPGGEILTNNHVIAGATHIGVVLFNSTKALPATVVGTDPTDDLALLQIKNPPSDLSTITFARSSSVAVGEQVVAIGNALGLSGLTVTEGIVSALNRTATASDPITGKTEHLTGLIQTQAPINSGDSGGPLVNSTGQVIGIDTAVQTSAGAGNAPVQGVGFAIPADTAQALIPKLRSGGMTSSEHAFLGVDVETMTPTLAAQYNLAATSGALIVEVFPGSPAQKAGLVAGDIIVGFDSKPVTSDTQLVADTAAKLPGQTINLTVVNVATGQRTTVSVVAGTAPAS
jgi:S1-C subfamily serine protease